MKKTTICVLAVFVGIVTAHWTFGQDRPLTAASWQPSYHAEWTADAWDGSGWKGSNPHVPPTINKREYFTGNLTSVEFENISLAHALCVLNGGLIEISIDYKNVPENALSAKTDLHLTGKNYLEVLEELFEDRSLAIVVDSGRYRTGVNAVIITTLELAADPQNVLSRSTMEFQYIRDYYMDFIMQDSIVLTNNGTLTLHQIARDLANASGIRVVCIGEDLLIENQQPFRKADMKIEELLQLVEDQLAVDIQRLGTIGFTTRPWQPDAPETSFVPSLNQATAAANWAKRDYGYLDGWHTYRSSTRIWK